MPSARHAGYRGSPGRCGACPAAIGAFERVGMPVMSNRLDGESVVVGRMTCHSRRRVFVPSRSPVGTRPGRLSTVLVIRGEAEWRRGVAGSTIPTPTWEPSWCAKACKRSISCLRNSASSSTALLHGRGFDCEIRNRTGGDPGGEHRGSDRSKLLRFTQGKGLTHTVPHGLAPVIRR